MCTHTHIVSLDSTGLAIWGLGLGPGAAMCLAPCLLMFASRAVGASRFALPFPRLVATPFFL